MDYKKMAKEIYEAAGKEENIYSVFNCATRLRLEMKDLKFNNSSSFPSIYFSSVKIQQNRFYFLFF